MPRTLTALLLAGLTLAGCNEPQQATTNQPAIRVRRESACSGRPAMDWAAA